MILLFLVLSSNSLSTASTNNEPIAYLILHTNGGGVRPDYGLYIAQYLRDLGIEVEVKVEEWGWGWNPFLDSNWDLGIFQISGGGNIPDMRDLYTQDGSLNVFRLSSDIPYYNESEQMQNLGVTITNLVERQQLYYNFQQLMMDKILPMLPLFSSYSYQGTWSNTLGFNPRWGIIDSLPYMSYNGFHSGQTSLTEFNLADANWRELNPLFTDDTSSSFIWDLISEPLLHFSTNMVPMNTGIINSWSQINDTHYKFNIRENIFWTPSYNITGRTASSPPLESIPNEELMLGLKNLELSNGTNQQVTAKDAVFTLLCLANPLISESTEYYEWISDCYIDPINPLAFHLIIDSDISTPQDDIYVDFWDRLSCSLLPEFFLNSSSPQLSYTQSGIECSGLYPEIIDTAQWHSYSTSAFGYGKYLLDYFVRNSITVLKRNPHWFGIGAIDGQQSLEPFVENINIRVIPDASAELAEFKAGKLDWCGFTLFPAERKLAESDPNFTVYKTISNTLSFLAFNLKRPFFGGPMNHEYMISEGKENYTRGVGIRKAICYTIDRDEINSKLHDGDYLVANSVIYPYTSYYYYNDVIKYDYNLELAKEWLKESYGYSDYSFKVLNIDKKDEDIFIKITFADELGDNLPLIYYTINDGSVQYATMNKESETTYSFNIGSGYTNGTKIECHAAYINIYNETRTTGTYHFYINVPFNRILTIESESIIFLIPTIMITASFVRDIRQKRKIF